MALRIRATHWLIAGALVASSPAFAQEGMFFKNLLENTFGGKRNDDIDYRERPALVVPPGSALPRPQEPGSARTAAWPNDPDVERRKNERKDALIPNTERLGYRLSQGGALSREEMARGYRRSGNGTPVVAEEQNLFNNQLQPIVLGRELALRQQQDDLTKLQYGTEPKRERLIEPPVGYRRPAGTAPVGPGQSGPVEDKQSAGIREFQRGVVPMQ